MNEFLKKEARTANSTYPKVAGFRVPKTVFWLIKH
jgi:hypothetical protein